MFENLSSKLQTVFKKLRGKGKLSEKDVSLALKEIKLALLEADVNYKVVKEIKYENISVAVKIKMTPEMSRKFINKFM
ncbi:signal recognition particle receptor subunit alpha [bacterium]|nr:signal recognition particle receptor subunit alpha [bacterium]